jgi:hypothetical protein
VCVNARDNPGNRPIAGTYSAVSQAAPGPRHEVKIHHVAREMRTGRDYAILESGNADGNASTSDVYGQLSRLSCHTTQPAPPRVQWETGGRGSEPILFFKRAAAF